MANAPDHEFPNGAPDGLEIIDRVGAGRRSIWYRARQVRLDRDVALKCLRPELAESEAFQRAFLDAGRQAAAMVHPAAAAIINVYPRHHAIATNWLSAKTLADRREDVGAAGAARIGVVVMDCLASLHATGRCHGNLSPGNVLLDDSDGVWVADFFQPPVMNDGARTFRSGQRHIAPEVISGHRGTDWRSDVFSLGSVMHGIVEASEGGCCDEFLQVLEVMRAVDRDKRGESPPAVLASLRKIKRLEDARVGKNPNTIRRRRMYRRVPAEFSVSMRTRSASPGETATILNRIRDLGESGVFVETDDDLVVVGSIIELDFELKGVEGRVHAFGVVRWKSAPPLPKGVGVQFMEVDQDGLARLRRYIDSKAGEEK